MKYHGLQNLVLYGLEGERVSTAAPLKLVLDWSTSDTENMNRWILTTPIIIINTKVKRYKTTEN